jgi:hypothetical protein
MQSLKRQLKKLHKQSAAPKVFKIALKAQLKEDLEETYPYMPARSRAFRVSFASAVIILLALTTGTGVYAYESPGVTEGHLLHPIKQTAEQVEAVLAFSPERKVRYHAKMMDRRLKEAEHFMAQPEKMQRAMEQVASELGVTVEELKAMPPKQEMFEQMTEVLQVQNTRFEAVIGELRENPPENMPEFEEVFEDMRERMQGAGISEEEMNQIFQQKHQNLRGHLMPNGHMQGLDKNEVIQ